MFEPIYYFGWVIQPTPFGYVVFDKRDHSRDPGVTLPTVEEAKKYIDERLK